MPRYKRVLLKLSGELFSDSSGNSLNSRNVRIVAKAIKAVLRKNVEVAIVVGAGNIFRARFVKDAAIDRVAADHMGMMGTIINALALESALEKEGIEARVLSAIPMPEIVEDYRHKRALKHFKNKRVVIFAGGTGRPFFTTDTAAVVRALEIGADVVLKASDVDGVYSADPHKNKNATKYTTLSFAEALRKKLKVMDATSFALAQENHLPIVVFKFSPANLLKAVAGRSVGTIIK